MTTEVSVDGRMFQKGRGVQERAEGLGCCRSEPGGLTGGWALATWAGGKRRGSAVQGACVAD